MLKFLADENFNYNIVRGMLRRNPDVDVVRVQDVGLAVLMIQQSLNGQHESSGFC